jgi:SsrA-binding protein
MSKAVKKTEFFNRKARFDYLILDSFEAGIVLKGEEIKAIRRGRVNLTGSYVKILDMEIFWLGGIINADSALDQQRTRKLLLHKSEINKLLGKSQEKGLALVPLKLYLTRGKAKLEVGVAKGKKEYEKRDVIKRRELNREIDRDMKA